MNKKLYTIFLFLSIGLYVISLTQKSYCSSFGPCNNFAFLSLFFGWLGVFMLHFPAFTWLANPILFIAWLLYKKKPKTAFVLSVISLGFMLSFLLVDEIIENEGGTTAKVVFYGLGYWLWVVSALLMAIGSLLAWKKMKNIVVI